MALLTLRVKILIRSVRSGAIIGFYSSTDALELKRRKENLRNKKTL